MMGITLSNLPSQSFSILLDTHQYDFLVRYINANGAPGVGVMAISIARDNIPVVTGGRAVPLFPLIPYKYLEAGEGNFVFVTLRGEYPNYTQFGITQSLLYLSQDELEAIRE